MQKLQKVNPKFLAGEKVKVLFPERKEIKCSNCDNTMLGVSEDELILVNCNVTINEIINFEYRMLVCNQCYTEIPISLIKELYNASYVYSILFPVEQRNQVIKDFKETFPEYKFHNFTPSIFFFEHELEKING